jgi:hypothetical protein
VSQAGHGQRKLPSPTAGPSTTAQLLKELTALTNLATPVLADQPPVVGLCGVERLNGRACRRRWPLEAQDSRSSEVCLAAS